MVIQLRSTYYHYCEIGENVVKVFIVAKSLGAFYNQNIKGSSNNGLYDCRGKTVPDF